MKGLFLFLAVFAAFLAFAPPPQAAAINLLGDPNASSNNDICSQAPTSAVCNDRKTSLPLTGPNGLIPKITKVVAYVAGAAAVIVILLSSFRYITSSGDSKNIESAKNTLIGAIIGLFIIVCAQSIVLFVVDRL